MPFVVRLATRGSPLARRQSELVATRLRDAAPGVEVVEVIVRTQGDRLAEVPLDRIAGQGAFVKEVQAAVLEGRADVAVHSAKDLPPATPEGLVFGAVPERADPRDALVGTGLPSLRPGARVATGSARRRAQLANIRPDLTFVGLRGNIGTRLERVDRGEVAAVVAAAAALHRLGLVDRPVHVLSTMDMLPQVGQGALALECRADDGVVGELLGLVDDERAHRAVRAERAMLAALGGSCSVPVAGWAEVEPGGAVHLQGLVASGDGRLVVREAAHGHDPEAVGRELGMSLLAHGSAAIDEGGLAGEPVRP